MAKVLGISAGYVNLLENNERSLSLRLLVALAGQLRRRLAGHRRRQDLESAREAAQRHQGPDVPGNARSDRVERGYRSCANDWWSYFYGVHRNTLERLMR
jgi:transcriptional regulator with XRE-family HTH domain